MRTARDPYPPLVLDTEEVFDSASAASRNALIRAPFHLDLQYADPDDLPSAAACSRATDFREWRVEYVPFPSAPLALLPEGASLVINVQEGRCSYTTAEGPGYVVYISAERTSTKIHVGARTGDHAQRILDAIKARIPKAPSNTVPFTLWRMEGDAKSWQRDLEVPAWEEIAANYPVRTELETLMGLTTVAGTGRLMLWTGEPGTGKTYAIRALARAWSAWCTAQLIIDPERFFGDAKYLIEIMSGEEHDFVEGTDVKKSRLIICEDADDFIRSRYRSGSGVGRLLNVADGLLGQGLNNIILLTSNTPAAQLDPALVRPGRLLANLEFGRFVPDEARTWLGDPAAVVPAAGMTLAELYERAGAVSRHGNAVEVPAPPGPYL